MSIWDFLRNIVTSESPDEDLKQVEALLPDGFPMRILESKEGYHVSVYPFPDDPPLAVSEDEVGKELFEQWLGTEWSG